MIDMDLNLLFALATVVMAGVVRGFSGFGSALVMAPLLSLLYGPTMGVVITAILEMVAVLQLLPAAVREADWRSLTPMVVAAVLTIPLGAWILVTVEADTMRRVIAAIVLVAVAALATGWQYRGKAGLVMSGATGILCGIIGGATAMGGPPAAIFYLGSQRNVGSVRGNLIGFFTVTAVFELLNYGLHGIITLESLARSALLTPVYIAALWLGSRMFTVASETLFRRVALVVLACIGVVALL
jgi:uncharacterized protein